MSYGNFCAKQSGIPAEIVKRAEEVSEVSVLLAVHTHHIATKLALFSAISQRSTYPAIG